MVSPIEALQHNITHGFENPNASAVDDLRQAIERGLVSSVLDLDATEGSPLPPKVVKAHREPAQITLHSAYLEMVWSWIYGWVVIYEEAVQREWMAGRFDGRIIYDTPLKSRAVEMLTWSSSLKDRYSSWPNGLPSPTHWVSEEEEFYVPKVNGIYVKTITFLLHHEFAHIRHGHFDAVNREDTASARSEAVTIEREADDFAYRALVAFEDDEDQKRLKAWSILAATLTSLQLVTTPAGLFQGRHPHLHHRIYEMLTRLNFQDQRWRGYYGYLANTVLELAFRKVSGEEEPSEPRVFETVEEAEADLLDRIDRFDPALHR